MLKVRILYDVPGWAYHRRAMALEQHAPGDIQVTLRRLDLAGLERNELETAIDRALGPVEPDIVFVLAMPEVKRIRRALLRRGWQTALLASWNLGWPHRLEGFPALYRDADAVVVNNLEAWRRLGSLPRTHALANGVDLDVFRVTRPPEGRVPRVVWAGSEYHREVKGYDDLVRPLLARVAARGVDTEALLVDPRGGNRRTLEEMVRWYNGATVLVCASRFEGTPNVALEAAACGCTLVSTRVGNIPELIEDGVSGFLVDRDLGALASGVDRALDRYLELSARLQQDIRRWGWSRRSRPIFDLMRSLAESGRGTVRARRSRPRPLASIVVPVLRQPDDWLEQCVRSAVDQTVAVEVVVVVSSHTPPSNLRILTQLAASHHGVRVLCEPEGARFAGAVNAGIEACSCDRVGLLLSDDWLQAEAVELCLEHDADIVATGRTGYDEDGRRPVWEVIPSARAFASLPTLEQRAGYLGHFFLFSRQAVDAVAGVDPEVGHTGADDYDMPWCMLEQGASVRLVERSLYNYRDHQGERLSLRSRELQTRDLLRVLEKHGVEGAERDRVVAAKSPWFGVPCHAVIESRSLE